MSKRSILLVLICLSMFSTMLFSQTYPMGDANHDGTVSILDALMAAQYSVGYRPDGMYFAEADVDCDGTLTIVDALRIAQYYVGITDTFPCSAITPTPNYTPTPPVSTGKSDLPQPATSGVSKPNGNPGNLSVLNWAGFKGAVSYTMDDANSSQINNYQRLNALGVRMTFYLWTNRTEASNNIWAQAVRDGHELGNHTASHPSSASASDIDAATNFIKQKFGVTPYTMASPYGDSSYISYAQSRFLLNRGVSGGSIAPYGNNDPFNLPSHIPATGASASALNSVATSARNNGHWQIYCIHGFTGGNDGAYQPFGLDQFESHVRYIKGLGDVWIDSAVNVGAYWRAQKMFAGISPSYSGSNQVWTWTLPNNFPPGKYVRVTVDGGTLMQDGKVLPWDDHGYYEVALDSRKLTLAP